ncbi:sugar ABC transporter substrate-binding protein [Paenibacillus dendritiformis]|uniref:ABC transporter substrate-binding protein n=1 Tax=Paenibacillus dendritiformis TaxID=130049 RepID=UPI0018CF2BC4|nr:extracellular solute-binding protein [Paenibacillus dendritiformis]MBG9794609.1 sugar ABC transporter substrate-binding protein [Paenibacillus dendritiformis]
MKKKWKVSILLLAVISLLGGCFGGKPALEELDSEGKGKIKVLYYDEGSFYSEYGNHFNLKYPNIEFEVISTGSIYENMRENGTSYEEEYLKFVEKHKPDVIMTSSDSFEKLVQEGKLYNLDTVIEQEKFDLDGYMPGLVELLRERGGGSLYGLAPYFNASVVYYNADLFREYQIDPPRNQMSWKELLELSSRFGGLGSGDDQIYGLADEFGQADRMLFNVALSSSLRVFDAKGEKITFNTDGWKEAMELTAKAIRDKAIYTASLEPEKEKMYYLQTEQFFKGKVAMILGSSWLMSNLRNQAVFASDSEEINWDFVTAPVDPAVPEESAFTMLSSIYAIAADSPNKRAAWEFVKFVNGPEMAKAASRSFRGELPTRADAMKEVDGKSMEPFYMLRPKASSGSLWGLWGGTSVNIPDGFRTTFSNIIIKELKAMVENGKSAEEAVAAIETEGNAALHKAREAAKAKEQSGKK